MKGMNKVGGWAFLIGVIVAILAGLFGSLNSLWVGILVVLGLIVGFLNVTGNETRDYLLAAVLLVIVAAFGKNVLGAISVLGNILDAMMVLVVPATVVVALRAVFGLARD